MRIPWHCPLCNHENCHKQTALNVNERQIIGYCDDAQDGGCGEGPFLVRFGAIGQAFGIAGQGYLMRPGDSE